MTVRDNVRLAATDQLGERTLPALLRIDAMRTREQGVRERADELIEVFELDHLAEEYSGNLSGGQRKLLELARALMLDPHLLLLDEPSAGLAPDLVDSMFDRIEAVNETGTVVLMVEQNAKEALRRCDRGYVLAQGENRYGGSGETLLDDEDVRRQFLGG